MWNILEEEKMDKKVKWIIEGGRGKKGGREQDREMSKTNVVWCEDRRNSVRFAS